MGVDLWQTTMEDQNSVSEPLDQPEIRIIRSIIASLDEKTGSPFDYKGGGDSKYKW